MRACLIALLLFTVPVIAAQAQTTTPPKAPLPPFDSVTPPPAPDYADPAFWALKPSKVDPAKPVDVFYVNPTTYPGPGWNQDAADATANAKTEGSVIITQASAFADCCRIYAPRYRQASSGALFLMDGDGGKAFALAYTDVLRAFHYYMEHDNHGRPFILAGHSQGTFHLIRLLEEEIEGKPAAKQLVAAYLIGIGLPQGFFGKTYKELKICNKPAETGCIVSWNTYVDGSDTSAYLKRSEGRYVQLYGDDPGKKLICINPLTFDASEPSGDARKSLGALTGPAVDGVLPPRKGGEVAAHCENGILFVDPPVQDAALVKPLPGGSLHMQDVELFYENLRRNALLRVKAWMTHAHR
jgi:hypothetical protein